MDESIVTLYVGANRRIFRVHLDILCSISSVLRTLLDPEVEGDSQRSMTLISEQPDSFEYFIDSIYRGHFVRNVFGTTERDGDKGLIMQSISLYILAEKYEVKFLQHDICLEIFRYAHEGESSERQRLRASSAELQYAYANRNQKSTIRQVLADWLAWSSKYSKVGEDGMTDLLYSIPGLAINYAITLKEALEKVRYGYASYSFDESESHYSGKLKEMNGEKK